MNPHPVSSALTIATPDGHTLHARVYPPVGQAHRAVLITCAMGVPQRFYEAFATWLASKGVGVMTFDWRGTGASAPRQMRGFVASIVDWAAKDLPAVVAAFKQQWPDLPATYLGHSLGGQVFGWSGVHTQFEHAVMVASGNGYWRLNAPGVKWRSPVLWWLLAPVATTVAGYFPGKRMGVVGDLPAAAMMQWRRWCLHPDYMAREGPHVLAQYARVTTPITAVVLDDDELITPQGIKDLYRLYASAQVRYVHPQAHAHGLRRIGHFGLFQGKAAQSLWPQTYDWLCAHA
jgi:predicted alpha/beta hydrolase